MDEATERGDTVVDPHVHVAEEMVGIGVQRRSNGVRYFLVGGTRGILDSDGMDAGDAGYREGPLPPLRPLRSSSR